MEEYKKLLQNNKEWAAARIAERSDFFSNTAEGQKPKFLWIGCSDSRVPAEQITGLEQGEIFVHRNIANMVIHTDFSVQSALLYAIEVLEVKHIIVCGHYNCGGVKAAMSQSNLGLINHWLRHIKDVYQMHSDELGSITDDDAKFRKMVELNAIRQVQHLAETAVVQTAWKKRNAPILHGWTYDLHDGRLHDIVTIHPEDALPDIYRYDL